MLSVMRQACDATTPRPTAGKMYVLLHCAMVRFRPSYWTGANGDPVATIARPPDQQIRSYGLASDFSVGFDLGKITGRLIFLDISRTMDSLNELGAVERPIRTDMSTLAMTSLKSITPDTRLVQVETSSAGCAYLRCSEERSLRRSCSGPWASMIQRWRRVSCFRMPLDSSAAQR